MRPIAVLLVCLGAAVPFVAFSMRAEAATAAIVTPQEKNDALIRAVEAGDVPYVKQLLREGADPNARLLWQRATNIDEYEPATAPVLYLALGWRSGNIGCYNALVGDSHRLIDANRDIVGALIRAGADVNVTDDNRFTPLSFAVQHNPTAVVKLLIDAGAKPSKGFIGQSLLHDAAVNYRDETAELLLRRGADPNSRDDQGRTPLAWAAGAERYSDSRQERQIRFVRVLLKYGADPLAYDKDKGTPLGASLSGNSVVLRLLLFAEQRKR